MESVEELLKEFLLLQRLRNRSPHTLKAYAKDLEQFFNEVGWSLDGLARKNIRSYLSRLRLVSKLSQRSIDRKVSSLRKFCRYLEESGHIEGSPAASFPRQRASRSLPSFLFQSKAHRLLSDVPVGDGYLSMRARMVFELLYGLGLRISELQQLDWENIDVNEAVVRVVGKGSKERVLPLTERLVGCLREFWVRRANFLAEFQGSGERQGRVFLNARGSPLSVRGVRWIFDGALSRLPYVVGVSPHGLRHSIATHLLENGCDLKVIQEFLGHKSLASTQQYTHLGRGHLRQKLQSHHPMYRTSGRFEADDEGSL